MEGVYITILISMLRNITLLYFILPTTMAWFWLGVWVLYYLRITNYAGIGLIEMAQITTGFILEIPTGGIADLLGKKRTLILALAFITCGNLLMAYSTTLTHLIISVIIIASGYAFSSGTTDALLYDSLKQQHNQNQFRRHLSKIETYKLFTVGIASIIGGFLYLISPSLPFLLTATATAVGFVMSFFLSEPRIDTESFSFRAYLNSLTKGFTALMHQPSATRYLLRQLFIMSLSVTIIYEVLDGALAIEFGLREVTLGIFFAVISIGAAIATNIFEKITPEKSTILLYIFFAIILLSSILSPLYGLLAGIVSICIRELLYPFLRIYTSATINHAVESTYRATTLSTFIMISKVPYVIFAYHVGRYMDLVGPSTVAFWIAAICGCLFLTISMLKPSLPNN